VTSTFIGELPTGWKSVPLKHLASFLSRGTPPVYAEKASIRAINQAANQESGIVWERTRFHKYHGAPELLKGHLIPNDIIINSTGTGTLGRVGYFSGAPDGMPCIADSHLTIVRLIPESLVPRFGFYWLKSQPFQEFMLSTMTAGSTNQIELSRERLGDSPTPVPPLEEQRRIADFLDAETSRIDRMLKARTAQKALLDERYLAEISELTVPGITDSKQRNHMWPWLPAEITLAQLGHYARIQTGITVHGSRSATSSDIEVPYLRVANVQGERLDLTEIKSIKVPAEMARRATLQPLDVVMTEANGNPDNLGRGALWRGEIPNMTHQNHIFAIRVNRRKLLPEYLVALLASLHGRRYFRFTSTQVGIATTSSTKVLKFPVPAIRIERQKEIVGNYEQAQLKHRKLIAAIKRQSELLEERRRALITAAVTGEFDVSTASGRGIED